MNIIFLNPKYEMRNSKQIPNLKYLKFLKYWNLFIVSIWKLKFLRKGGDLNATG